MCIRDRKKAYVEYLLDLFLYESEEEQKAWIAEHTAETVSYTHLDVYKRQTLDWLYELVFWFEEQRNVELMVALRT